MPYEWSSVIAPTLMYMLIDLSTCFDIGGVYALSIEFRELIDRTFIATQLQRR